MNISKADRFLSRFNYERTTIQVFPIEVNGKPAWPKRGGRILCTGEKGSTAIAIKGCTLSRHEKLLRDLKLLQKQRMGVYFMVNEGDGQRHNHTIIRNSDAVQTLKALFVDTDEGDYHRLNKFCTKKKIRPHIVVQSSPGKFHYYFLINDSPADKENTFLWQSCQHRLARLDPAFDDSMADLGQVLRIPGFYHTKRAPYLIRIVHEDKHKPYNLDELFERLGAEKTPPRKGSRFERPQKRLTLGARHEALSAYLGSTSNSLRDPDALIDAAIGFAQRSFKDPADWLPGGNRYSELRDQVSYVISEREKEDNAAALAVIPDTKQAQGFAKLSDEFYKSAPGLVGRIVRELCHYAAQPYPSFSFAAACALVGTLKAPFVRGEYRDTPPSTYFLCLATTGRGKDFSRAMIVRSFIRMGLRTHLTQRFRSAQGFMKRLSQTHGTHLVLHDEAHHLFSQIRKSDNEYMTALKPHLLSIFSEANSPVYDVGQVVTEKMDINPIPYPTLNYCGFAVPEGFEDNFQGKELTEGLLTRFLVLRDHQPVLPLNFKAARVPAKFKFEKRLRLMSTKLRTMMDAQVLDDDKRSDTSTIRKFITVPLTAEAKQTLYQYSQRIADQRNSAASPAHDALQSRLVEQAARLAVILSDTETTKEIVEYAIKFVDHCYENVAAHVESFEKGQGNKDVDRLVDFITSRMRINQGPMQARELCYFAIRDRRQLTDAIELGITLGRIRRHEHYRKPGKTKGRTSTAYSVIESI